MTCYNQDLLFIHIPRCGGTSCRAYLREHIPGLLTPDNPLSKLPTGHIRLADIERQTGRSPASFEKIIAIVRNPYEQQVSQAVFCAKRYLGDSHPDDLHDLSIWRYVAADLVQTDLRRCSQTAEPFHFLPQHINLTGCVADPRCDFHPWYPSAWSPEMGTTYADFGGFYLYWFAIDGKIPENLTIVRFEELATAFPLAVAVDTANPTEPMPHLNTSPHVRRWNDYYTPAAVSQVRRKFAWAFTGLYDMEKSLQ